MLLLYFLHTFLIFNMKLAVDGGGGGGGGGGRRGGESVPAICIGGK